MDSLAPLNTLARASESLSRGAAGGEAVPGGRLVSPWDPLWWTPVNLLKTAVFQGPPSVRESLGWGVDRTVPELCRRAAPVSVLPEEHLCSSSLSLPVPAVCLRVSDVLPASPHESS